MPRCRSERLPSGEASITIWSRAAPEPLRSRSAAAIGAEPEGCGSMNLLRRIALGAGIVVAVLGAAIGATFLWAATATDTSQLARGLIWCSRRRPRRPLTRSCSTTAPPSSRSSRRPTPPRSWCCTAIPCSTRRTSTARAATPPRRRSRSPSRSSRRCSGSPSPRGTSAGSTIPSATTSPSCSSAIRASPRSGCATWSP